MRRDQWWVAAGIVGIVVIVLASFWIRVRGCAWTCEELGAGYVKITTAACICERDGSRFAAGHP